MGFGLLVIGYMMLFSVPFRGIDLPPDALAYVIMLLAVRQLGRYNARIKHSLYALPALIVCSALTLALQLAASYGLDVPSMALSALSLASMALQLPFFILLLTGVGGLCEEVKLPRLSGRAALSLYLIITFDIFTVFVNLYIHGIIPPAAGISAGALFALQQLAGYAVRIFVLAFFVSCYMHITLEDDDENYKPGFFEKLLEKQQRRKNRD